MAPAMIVTPADSNPERRHPRATAKAPGAARAALYQPAGFSERLGRASRLILLLVFLGWVPVLFGADANPNSACLECHGDKTLTKTNAAGKEISLFVDVAKFASTVHQTNTCAGCHADLTDKHPDDNLPAKPPACASCHEGPAKDYASSIHGMSHSMGASGAATCKDCHGSHHILPAKHADSPVFKLNLPYTCANCHTNVGLTKEYQMKFPEAAAAVHGQHPRSGAAQNGADRRPFLQRLPRRA